MRRGHGHHHCGVADGEAADPVQHRDATEIGVGRTDGRHRTAEGGDDLRWAIYARQGQSVGFQDSGFMPEVRDYDYVVDGLTGGTGELVIDASSIPAFDPGQTYHAVIVHQNCPNTRAVVSATSFTDPEPLPDAGVDAATPDAAPSADASGTPPDGPRDGCGCHAQGGAAPALPGLLLGLLVVGWRLRRRRR